MQQRAVGGAAQGSDSASDDELDLQNEEGWEDAEPDVEEVTFACLFCQHSFEDLGVMLQHCTDIHDFDLPNLRNRLGVWVMAFLS